MGEEEEEKGPNTRKISLVVVSWNEMCKFGNATSFCLVCFVLMPWEYACSVLIHRLACREACSSFEPFGPHSLRHILLSQSEVLLRHWSLDVHRTVLELLYDDR